MSSPEDPRLAEPIEASAASPLLFIFGFFLSFLKRNYLKNKSKTGLGITKEKRYSGQLSRN